MTDINIFKFITVRSILIFFKNLNNLDYLDHDFIPIRKFEDKSGCTAICKKCNIYSLVYRADKIYFSNSHENDQQLYKLTCGEIIVKSILE